MSRLVLSIRDRTPDVGPECTGWFRALILDGEDGVLDLITNSCYTKSNIGKVCADLAKLSFQENNK